jgi:large subunit ribosomal protein L1
MPVAKVVKEMRLLKAVETMPQLKKKKENKMKISKNRKASLEKIEVGTAYSLKDASELIKEITTTKFDASIDLHIRLGVDPKNADQAIRGTVSLPHGTGKEKRVLVLCTPDQEAEAKEAGADHVGLDEYVKKIEEGWTDIDVIVASPTVMAKMGKIGKILGPRGLMPNPKSGTVTMEVGKAVKEVKKGKISYRVDKEGIVHASVGRASFEPNQIFENSEEFINTIQKVKPSSAKGTYFKSIYMVSSMSPGLEVDVKSVV